MSTDWILTFMEKVKEELQDYDDKWTLQFNYELTNTLTDKERRSGWKIFNHCAHGQFKCSSCSNTWPSARVMVLFRYRLQETTGRGTVLMRPSGQACRRCLGAKFERPRFSQSEVDKALLRLFEKIRKNCYGEAGEDDHDGPVGSEVRTKPHEKSLCEGCRQGFCCQEDKEE